jgi:hypothetical protein
LSLENVQLKDHGSYSTVAQNKVGKATSKCDLLVVYLPKIKTPLKDASVIVKRNILLEIEVESSIQCTAEWVKDSTSILGPTSPAIAEGRMILQERKGGIYQISIKNAKEEDAGVYQCVVKNKIGSVETSAKLEVYTPPVFLQKLDKIDAVENCEAELCVEVSGNPRPAVIWSRNSDQINTTNIAKYEEKISGNFYSLIIKSIALNDAGSYQCSVSNVAGKATSMGKLTIYPLTSPKFIKQLDASKLFGENENVQLSVQVSGIPIPKIFWYKNGELLNEQLDNFDFKKDLSKGTYSVLGKSTGKQYSGNYEVKASNPGGEICSVCELRVDGYRPVFLDKPEKIVCLEGKTATLGCLVDGKPEPSVKWMLKGKEIVPDSKKYKSYYDEELKAHFLEISACGSNDKATYQVVASNEHGSETTAVTLIISDKPEEVSDYKSGLKNVALNARDNTDDGPDWGKLRKGDGKEQSLDDDINKYKLRHFEKPIAEVGKVEAIIEPKVREAVDLEIHPGNEIDLGEYQKSSLSDVVEIGAKIIKKLPKVLNSKINEKVSLEVQVIGLPKPIVSWYLDDKEIKQNKNYNLVNVNDEEFKLTINKMDKPFCGFYSIKASNSCGNDSSDCKVHLMQKPEILDNVKDLSVIEAEPAQFQCQWSSYPKATVIWYEDNVEMNCDFNENYEILTNDTEGTSILKIQNCKIVKANTKVYTVKLSNEFGLVESRKAILTINCKLKRAF